MCASRRGIQGLNSTIYDPERRTSWFPQLPAPQRRRMELLSMQLDGLTHAHQVANDWLLEESKKVPPQTRGLNQNRQPLLKNVFKGAAETVIHVMPKHPLSIGYQRMITAGTKPNLARLTAARRIAGAILAMWKNQEKYDPSKQQQ